MVLGCLVIVVGLGLFLGASELEGLLFEGDEHEGVGAGSWGVEHEYVVQGAWDYFFGLRVPEDPWEHRQTFLGLKGHCGEDEGQQKADHCYGVGFMHL